MQVLTARQEWRAMWPLPLVSMLGVSGMAMFAYSSGVFMADITAAFGWSRAQYSLIFTLMMLSGLVLLPAVGWLTDRYGPRRIALIGIVPFAFSFASFGLANGSILQWYMLGLMFAPFQALIGIPVWIAAVVSRFNASRGMAMAVGLAGLGLGSMAWPLLAAHFIETFGWRPAFGMLALCWTVPILPLALLCFYGADDRGKREKPAADKRAYGPALRSRTFAGLMVAAGLFMCGSFGITAHSVPILSSQGFSLASAAAIAGLIGACSFTGRLITGYLLDRLPLRLIAVTAFALPAVTAALLLWLPGSTPGAILAVVCLGLSGGAELDIVAFLAARRFGQTVFASIYALFSAITAACASIGPVLAGAFFDRQQSYDGYLLLVIPMMIVSAGVIAWLPMEPES